MTKFCPVCGTPNEDSAHSCIRCGYNFDQQSNFGQSAEPFQENVPTSMNIPSDDNFNLIRNLDSLRNAFFWLFIGLILLIIPLITLPVLGALIVFDGSFWLSSGLILLIIPLITVTITVTPGLGELIVFVGFIRLISGFGKISKTSLGNADYYRSTRNWLLASLFGLLITVVDAFILIIHNTAASGITTISSLLTFKGSSLLILLWAVGIMGIILIIYLVAYIKLIKSLKFLSEDLQVKKLYSAGNYLLYSLIIYIISIIYLTILLFISYSAIANSLSSGLTTGSLLVKLGELTITFAPIIISLILQLIGYHFAYKGIDEFVSRYYNLAAIKYKRKLGKFP